jgi:RNA-binding protein YhbY
MKDSFLRFACTGARDRLIREINSRLQDLEGVKVEVIGGVDQVMDYQAWLGWTAGRSLEG